jgi:hypothetical protein
MSSIILKMLEVQNQVKIYHFQTVSYARHLASDRLFTSLLVNIDRFGEVLQNSKRIKLDKSSKLVLRHLNDKDMFTYLSNFALWLEIQLPKLISGYRKGSVDLLNIRDEILADVNQTLYLFSFK